MYLIVAFKTFYDYEWEKYWAMFVVIKNFFSSLVDDKNKFFKIFLNTDSCYGCYDIISGEPDYRRSIFFEIYILLETTANYTFVWLNDKPKLLPSDKPDLFLITKSLMDLTSECITGPCKEN